MMSMRYRGSVACRHECKNCRGRMFATTRAASSAVLSLPASEGVARRYNPAGPQKLADPIEQMVSPASSGLDFIDLVSLDDSTVWSCLQDAVTYRVLVGRCPSNEPSCNTPHIESFNLKQLKSYRDNVTRNLAPTVARGFANAARAAGHIISTTPSTAASSVALHKPGQLTELPRAGSHFQAAPTPPPPSLRTQAEVNAMEQLQKPMLPSTGSVVGSAVTAASATAGTPDLASTKSYVSQRTRSGLSVAPEVGGRQLGQPVQSGKHYPADPAPVIATDVSAPAAAAAAAVRCGEVTPASAITAISSSPFEKADAGADSAVAASMYGGMTKGRRRGSRGASRGRLVAVAGRHVSGAAASAGPAWT